MTYVITNIVDCLLEYILYKFLTTKIIDNKETNMESLKDMKIIIDEMRQTLSSVIDEKQNLLDAEVIAMSQKLDDILNTYNNLLEKK